MMNLRWLQPKLRLFIILYGMVVSVLAAKADSPAEARKAIQAAYNNIEIAHAHKNVQAELRYCAPEYQMVATKRGRIAKIDLAFIRRILPKQHAKEHSYKGRTTIQKFTLHGARAMVRIQAQGETVFMNPQTKKLSKSPFSVVADDTWVKKGHRWLRTYSRIISY